jgi:hypothetical protein
MRPIMTLPPWPDEMVVRPLPLDTLDDRASVCFHGAMLDLLLVEAVEKCAEYFFQSAKRSLVQHGHLPFGGAARSVPRKR